MESIRRGFQFPSKTISTYNPIICLPSWFHSFYMWQSLLWYNGISTYTVFWKWFLSSIVALKFISARSFSSKEKAIAKLFFIKRKHYCPCFDYHIENTQKCQACITRLTALLTASKHTKSCMHPCLHRRHFHPVYWPRLFCDDTGLRLCPCRFSAQLTTSTWNTSVI